jgi:glycosyltransferase involved in cell wall biosynthesis
LPCDQRKLTVIHNGIDAPVNQGGARDLTRRELGVADLLVGAIVARIDGRKGHATLLHALRRLKEQGVELAVLVIGDGREREAIEALGKQFMLEGMLKFLGSRSDVDRLLQAADFFVLPSDTEGLPMSLLEAMSHGLPIVATRVGGIPELIGDRVEGLLVPSGDASALARAILELYEQQPLRERLGVAALARCANEFSLANTAQNYDRVYKRAMNA